MRTFKQFITETEMPGPVRIWLKVLMVPRRTQANRSKLQTMIKKNLDDKYFVTVITSDNDGPALSVRVHAGTNSISAPDIESAVRAAVTELSWDSVRLTLPQVEILSGNGPLTNPVEAGFCSVNIRNLHAIDTKALAKFLRGKYIWIWDKAVGPIHLLWALNIKDLEELKVMSANIDTNKAVAILNRHLKGERDVLDCQEELIKAGYKEYAKL